MKAKSQVKNIYATYKKPSRAPPAYVFGIVRSILYGIILISFWYTVYQVIVGQFSRMLLIPFAINLFANLIFTYIQFKLRRNDRALVDIIIVLATILWIMAVTWNTIRRVSIAQIPYLLRVSIATALATYIYKHNK